jgi:uncharacterized protein YdbL (DUF1318 family)
MMSLKKSVYPLIALVLLLMSMSLSAKTLLQEWKQGLSGAKLTAFSGSVTSDNSTLTVIKFCPNGRYSYYKEGSWRIPGEAGGASNRKITGRWGIRQNGMQILLTYHTDSGKKGFFPLIEPEHILFINAPK